MGIPADARRESQLRSLQTLQDDYGAFMAAGGDIRRAKHFNVIAPYFLEIPLDQVYI